MSPQTHDLSHDFFYHLNRVIAVFDIDNSHVLKVLIVVLLYQSRFSHLFELVDIWHVAIDPHLEIDKVNTFQTLLHIFLDLLNGFCDIN